MFQEKVEEEYIVTQAGTSEGTQIKYKKGDYWYKKDNRGKEGLAEYLVSKLLTFSGMEQTDYVLYEQGYINGIPGCRSKNFLGEGFKSGSGRNGQDGGADRICSAVCKREL